MAKAKTLLWLLTFLFGAATLIAQDQTVLRWNVSLLSQASDWKIFDFNLQKFTEFYTCLCNNKTSRCQAYALKSEVTYLENRSFPADEGAGKEWTSRFACFPRNNNLYVICDRLNISDWNCNNIERCSSYHFIHHSISCNFEPVQITWKSGYVTDTISNNTALDLDVMPCEGGCLVTDFTKSTTMSPSEDKDDSTIIIAVIVSILAVLIVASIIGVVMWRRKKNAKARATRYATKDNTGSNDRVRNPTPTNGGGASNATDLHNYSLATIDRDGKSSGNMDSISVSYAKVDLEKKHAARRSAEESTSNEDPQYSQYNSNQNYTEVGPPVPPYNDDHTGANGFSVTSAPKVKGNGKIAVNSADNGVSYSEIAVNNNDDEDNETEPYSVSGSNGPSDSKTGTNADDPQYSFASDVKPGPGNVYSQLHDPVRNITNPYNDLIPEDGSANKNVETRPGHEYSRLHDPVRNINNPYNVLMADGDQLNNRTSV